MGAGSCLLVGGAPRLKEGGPDLCLGTMAAGLPLATPTAALQLPTLLPGLKEERAEGGAQQMKRKRRYLRPSLRQPKGVRARCKANKDAKAKRDAAKAALALREERIAAGLECDVSQDEEDAVVAGPATKEHSVNSCVKMKLASFCLSPDIRKVLDSVVMNTNTVMAEAYAFANFHITRLLENGDAVPSVDAKLYFACITAVTICKQRSELDPSMVDSIQLFDALRPSDNKVDYSLLGDIKSELCIGMAAMATNHLWMNLEARLSKYLEWSRPDIHKKQRKAIVQCVAVFPGSKASKFLNLKTEKGKKLQNSRKVAIENALAVVADLRELCPIKSTGVATKAHLLLPLYWKMMRDTEAAQAAARDGSLHFRLAKKIRRARFSLLPNKNGFTVSHVPICTRAMIGVLRRVKGKDGLPITKHTTNNVKPREQDTAWRKFFNVNSVETFERYFGNRISTDGVAVTVYMERTQACVLSTTSTELDSSRIELERGELEVIFAGVDPGLTDVVTIAHTQDESITGKKAVPASTSSYSSSRYFEEAKFKLSGRRTNAWNAETKASTDRIDFGSDRSNVAGLSSFLKTYLAEFRSLLKHRATRGYRNMRFMRYKFKQVAVSAICDLVAPPDKYTVVGYGDWSGPNGTPIKRRFCGPQQDIKRELQHRPNVLYHSVWEHKTSVTCHETWRRLSNMRAESRTYSRSEQKMVDRKRGAIHKVLHCRSSKSAPGREGGGTWNRDVNAARNILMLLMLEVRGAERPAEFMPTPIGTRRAKKPVPSSSSKS